MPEEPTPLKDKIKFVLTEVRVVLPGAQALLGFQFAALLQQSFDKLPESLKYIHLASLASIALCTCLLMTPAAFHRIAERGQDTERLHTFSTRMLLGAMVFLALGIGGDMWVVVQKVTESPGWGLTGFAGTLIVFWGLWFGYVGLRKLEQSASGHTPTPQPSK